MCDILESIKRQNAEQEFRMNDKRYLLPCERRTYNIKDTPRLPHEYYFKTYETSREHKPVAMPSIIDENGVKWFYRDCFIGKPEVLIRLYIKAYN